MIVIAVQRQTVREATSSAAFLTKLHISVRRMNAQGRQRVDFHRVENGKDAVVKCLHQTSLLILSESPVLILPFLLFLYRPYHDSKLFLYIKLSFIVIG